MRIVSIPFAFICLASLAFFGCAATDSPSTRSSTPSNAAPEPSDLVACEQIVRNDLADESASCFNYSPEFRESIRRAYAAVDEFGISVLNADHRYKTQDGKPEVLSIGPALGNAGKIEVPVLMRWPGSSPYTVTWILGRAGVNWQVEDLLTAGHQFDNGSLLQSVKNL